MIPRIDYDMMFRGAQERLGMRPETGFDHDMESVKSQETPKWFLSRHFIRTTGKN